MQDSPTLMNYIHVSSGTKTGRVLSSKTRFRKTLRPSMFESSWCQVGLLLHPTLLAPLTRPPSCLQIYYKWTASLKKLENGNISYLKRYNAHFYAFCIYENEKRIVGPLRLFVSPIRLSTCSFSPTIGLIWTKTGGIVPSDWETPTASTSSQKYPLLA